MQKPSTRNEAEKLAHELWAIADEAYKVRTMEALLVAYEVLHSTTHTPSNYTLKKYEESDHAYNIAMNNYQYMLHIRDSLNPTAI